MMDSRGRLTRKTNRDKTEIGLICRLHWGDFGINNNLKANFFKVRLIFLQEKNKIS